MSITIVRTYTGCSDPKRQTYKDKEHGMEAWDRAVEAAVGGDIIRLINDVTGAVMSEYKPVLALRDRLGYGEFDEDEET